MMKGKKKVKIRNPFAVHGYLRSGAGSHGSKKKQESRDACRKLRLEVVNKSS